jgi:hypothetical protein
VVNVTSEAGDWGFLDDIPVSALNAAERQFLVPDYQRGYRWGEAEVTQLLEDIRVSTEKRYYLQPVVVKPKNGELELVDGQQRLTTLFLVTKWLQDHHYLDDGPMYTIRYATRERSEAYLTSPSREEAEKNIDFHHIFEAFTAIDEWARTHPSDVQTLAEDLDEKVRLLWFEAPEQVSGEEMFRRLNSGKIPLTNAELVKALLVSLAERPSELAAQWDAFERDLWDPELWAFVDGGRIAASRIELLLDALADEYRQASVPRAPFHTFNAIRARIEDSDRPDEQNVRAVWDDVVRLHSRVLAWADDLDLYHRVGYLIATGKKTFGELIAESHDKTRPKLARHLRQLIRETLPDSWDDLLGLSYENRDHRRRLEHTLLLLNVETVRQAKRERFPFSEHRVVNRQRAWSLEHIHAQHAQSLGPDGRRAWLGEHQGPLEEMRGDDDRTKDVLERIAEQLKGKVERQAFEDLQRDVLLLMQPDELDVDEVHSISNLALLDKDQNSSLGNSAYEVKRRKIIEMDRAGQYVPVCTRNAFLKYYTSEGIPHLHYWSSADRKGYLDEIRRLLYPEGDHE